MARTILTSVLLLFVGVNLYAVGVSGWDGFVAFLDGANGWAVLFLTDLFIALGLVATWMIKDARSQGRSAMPYVLLTVATGSIGPLVYLLKRRP